MITVLHVSPHPDDEVLGAGGALRLLRLHEHRIHNLACSLGRPSDHQRRKAELLQAAQRLDLRTTVMSPPAAISSSDDLDAAEHTIADAVEGMISSTGADVVVSPHLHDSHHGHEVVARAVRDALSRIDSPPRWWMWGLWSDLPMPTIYAAYTRHVMADVRETIAAYAGENARNQYDQLHPARAAAHAILGAERVFGYGSNNTANAPYADLLTEVQLQETAWWLCAPRRLDSADPLPPDVKLGFDITWWINATSITTRLRAAG